MKFLLLFLAIYLTLYTASSTARMLYHKLIYRSDLDAFGLTKRSTAEYNDGGVQVHPLVDIPSNSKIRQTHFRKGEGLCNGKVCMLQLGEVPKGCNGICQYRTH